MDEDRKIETGGCEVLDDMICIPVKEYKRLVRCEASLHLLCTMHGTVASYDFDSMVKTIKLMHQDMFPPIIKAGDDE